MKADEAAVAFNESLKEKIMIIGDVCEGHC